MTFTKLFQVLGCGVAIVLTGCATHVALTPAAIFQRAQARYASLTSYRDAGTTVSVNNGTTFTTTFNIRLARTNYYRIEWEQPETSSYTNKGVVWSAGQGEFLAMGNEAPQKYDNREMALSSATGISGRAAATIPGTFFQMHWGNQLGGPVTGQIQQADERVGKADCYVFTSESKGRTKTLWIGKRDYLIHQVRNVTSAAALAEILADAAKRNPQIHVPLTKTGDTGIISTETHTDIQVNPKLTPADFAP